MTIKRGNIILCAITIAALALFLWWRAQVMHWGRKQVTLWDLIMQYLADSGVVDMGDIEWERVKL